MLPLAQEVFCRLPIMRILSLRCIIRLVMNWIHAHVDPHMQLLFGGVLLLLVVASVAGWIRTSTGSYSAAWLVAAGLCFASVALALSIRRAPSLPDPVRPTVQ